MHKKRGMFLAAVVLIMILAMILIASNSYYYKNTSLLMDALRVMRANPEKGFELCGQISVEDYAKDCYASYLSVEIERIKSEYPNYQDLSPEEKRDAAMDMLNKISEKTERVCSIKLMEEESMTCQQVQSVIELQKEKALNS